jgi:two-component system cell cycle sensor histidine kinase/response regulator CckA
MGESASLNGRRIRKSGVNAARSDILDVSLESSPVPRAGQSRDENRVRREAACGASEGNDRAVFHRPMPRCQNSKTRTALLIDELAKLRAEIVALRAVRGAGERGIDAGVGSMSDSNARRGAERRATEVERLAQEIIATLPMIEELDERRRTQAALGGKTEDIECFFALSLDLFCIADIDGTLQRLNSAWDNALGVPPREIAGTRLADWVHPDDKASTEAMLADLAGGRQAASFSNRLRCSDGSYRWFEWRATSGERHVLYAVGRDVTERVRQEAEQARLAERLRDSQKLESVGRLAGGVAHDFNNLLTCITGNLSLVLMDLSEEDPLHEILMEVSNAADNAAKLTRQLLVFSRRQLVEPTTIDLNGLVERTRQMLVRLIGEDIALSSKLQPSLGHVKVDAGQIEQVLANLAVNARDAMPDGGSLVLQTAEVVLGAEYTKDHPDVSPGEYVMLEVSDTGAGMSDEAKQHLFEPFFTTKPRAKGTGLGLATAYGAIKQAGGTIEISSDLGSGTSVRMYLPRVQEGPAPPDVPITCAGVPSGTETVLLVEDERAVLHFATRSLRRLGYTVLACPTPAQALTIAAKHEGRIDILVTDVVMPGMDGRALADHVKQVRPDTVVLFTSGYTENGIGHHGVIERGLAFLPKPYTTQGLSAKVREVLSAQSLQP